jgi:hypothetical protein
MMFSISEGADLNYKEVNCTEPFPSVRVPCYYFPYFTFVKTDSDRCLIMLTLFLKEIKQVSLPWVDSIRR